MEKQSLIGKSFIGFKFATVARCAYVYKMNAYIGVKMEIIDYSEETDNHQASNNFWYPSNLVLKDLVVEDEKNEDVIFSEIYKILNNI